MALTKRGTVFLYVSTIMNSNVIFWTMGVIAGVSVLCKVNDSVYTKEACAGSGENGKE